MTILRFAIEFVRARLLAFAAALCAMALLAAVAGADYAMSGSFLSVAALLICLHAATSSQPLFPKPARIGVSLRVLSVRNWMSFQEALQTFCDPQLVRARSDAALEINKIMLGMISEQRSKAATLKAKETARNAAQKQRDQATRALEQSLIEKLSSGTLVARGLVLTNDSVKTQTIQPDEWPDAEIDLSAGTVRTKAAQYRDVLVGEPRLR